MSSSRARAIPIARGTVPLSDALSASSRADPAVQALVARYAAAAAPIIARPIGRLPGPALKEPNDAGESVGGRPDRRRLSRRDQRAGDGQRAARLHQPEQRAHRHRPGGGRDRHLRPALRRPAVRQQSRRHDHDRPADPRRCWSSNSRAARTPSTSPIMLQPSRGFSYSYDLRRPEGQRILDMRLNGAPITRRRLLPGDDQQLPRRRRRQLHDLPAGDEHCRGHAGRGRAGALRRRDGREPAASAALGPDQTAVAALRRPPLRR